MTRRPTATDYDVVVVGAGFAGLYQLQLYLELCRASASAGYDGFTIA